MFSYADADLDGRINWSEFQTMINPPKPADQWASRPTKTDLAEKTTLLHPHTLSVSAIMHQGGTDLPLRELKPVLKKSKIVPIPESDTHIFASWNQIGLPTPVSNT